MGIWEPRELGLVESWLGVLLKVERASLPFWS